MSKLIGLVGLKGSGKDTVAKRCIYIDGGSWKKMSFASTLKDAVSDLFGWDRTLVEGDSNESREWREKVDTYWERELGIEGFTPRKALQIIGTDLIRNKFDEGFWIKALKRKIINTTSHVFVTDVRFPNEYKMIKSLGGKIVQVVRGDLPEWWDDAVKLNNGNGKIEDYESLKNIHESEYSLAGNIEPDYIIYNNSGLNDLHKECIVMMNKLY